MNRITIPAWLWVVIPLLVLVGLVYLFIYTDPLRPLGISVPPVEELTVERTILDEKGIHLKVRANGSEPVSIAQVLVDDAYWQFSQEPGGPVERMDSVSIHIPYPWVEGEFHEIKLITKSGITFSHEIEVAEPTPEWNTTSFAVLGIIGIFVGIVPVALGLMFYPFIKTLGNKGFSFVLALTVGLLAFLFVDTLSESLEIAGKAAGVFEAPLIMWLIVLISFLVIFFFGRQGGKAPEGTSLAWYLALGIGLHNLGEGLAIGAALTSGEVALGTFLIIGFTLHNITEGIGIAAPMVRETVAILIFGGLAILAGAPAVLGIWIGVFAYSPHWTMVLLAVGAGAILQVIVEVVDYLIRNSRASSSGYWLSPASLSGFVAGVAVMYATSLIVSF